MLFDEMAAFYQKASWPMEKIGGENDTIMATNYKGTHGSWLFFAMSDEENRIIILFARAPEVCPPEKVEAVSHFLELANFKITHGAWIMDRSDGEIRYRVGVDMADMELTDNYLRDLSYYTNMTMDTYLPGLRSILKEGKSAREAFETVRSRF